MKDLIATYYFRTKDGVDASYAANAIREEQTTGTWTSLSTVNDKTAYVHALDGSVEDRADYYLSHLGRAVGRKLKSERRGHSPKKGQRKKLRYSERCQNTQKYKTG